jgi:glutaminyl-peptide cyclotransferase
MKYFLYIFLIVFISCTETKNNNDDNNKPQKKVKKTSTVLTQFKLLFPPINSKFKISENIVFKINNIDTIPVDSIKINIDQTKNFEFNITELSFIWKTNDSRVGIIPFTVEIYAKNKHQYISGKVELLSDIKPVKKTYKIINTYPHDIKAYTQGLKYDNGFLYEGTGQFNESSLRKVKLETGELVQSYQLPKNVFGEGITFYKDKIIQLTWKSWTGYVYDKKEFKLLYTFNYPVPIEGWGVEYNGQYLIVSDGTSNLMFFDPDSFTEIYRIQVYDNVGPVDQLNELEYVDGILYANRYLTNKILKIDPKMGKVLEEIDLSGLLDKSDYHQHIDVLNGIAIDKENNRIFVTGKYWPKLFQIEII